MGRPEPAPDLVRILRFWETGRIVFNLVLVGAICAAVVTRFAPPPSLSEYAIGFLLPLIVLANLAYCAGYPVDIAARLALPTSLARALRWGLLGLGSLVSAGIGWEAVARA